MSWKAATRGAAGTVEGVAGTVEGVAGTVEGATGTADGRTKDDNLARWTMIGIRG